jgi:hypothetical protein
MCVCAYIYIYMYIHKEGRKSFQFLLKHYLRLLLLTLLISQFDDLKISLKNHVLTVTSRETNIFVLL